ncbi:hypothetical protein JW998_05335 [candidate division KSB1 bacterium]|nr:hypothetical protein [candidate division KSB1 bacterium]
MPPVMSWIITKILQLDIAHAACTMIHMANIAHRVGDVGLSWDPLSASFVNNDQANGLLKREYRRQCIPESL